MRVVCAMSGGVDSSLAAALMVEAGHEVVGMTMRLYDASVSAGKGRGGTCCSPAEVDLAQRACENLGIPHYTVDESERFKARVIDDFVREYAAGRTPNPCARCNEHVKFEPLWRRAIALGAELLVTGHYARVVDGGLHRGRDPAKDQSYFLFAMGRATLAHVAFPLGEWAKNDVRARARDLGMPNADAPDSQELCFVPDGDHGDVVARRARELGVDTQFLEPGEIRDSSGKLLGQHRGIHRVTVGQRRGLGVSSTQPRYVLDVLPASRTVVVGDESELERTSLDVRDFQPLADVPDGTSSGVQIQIRHRSRPVPGTIERDGARLRVHFERAVKAIAPGQAAVVYRGDQVLGGGWIE